MKYLARCVVPDFAEFARVCHRDPGFPQTVEQWNELIARADAAAAAEQEELPPDFIVDPAAFERWCHSVEIIPSIDALKAYLIVQRARELAKAVTDGFCETSLQPRSS